MGPFNVFIAPQVDVPADVIDAAGKRLARYFDAILLVMKPRTFTQTTFKVSPHARDVGTKDLLIYITQKSLIVSLFDTVYDPGTSHSLPGSPGGGTKAMPNGRVLSEVFWTGGLMSLQKNVQGIALANLMFHELAHNKHASDPTALRNGEVPNGDFVHFSCGGGILQRGVTFGLAARLDINSDNVRSMARVLDSANQQEVCGVFNDDLGF